MELGKPRLRAALDGVEGDRVRHSRHHDLARRGLHPGRHSSRGPSGASSTSSGSTVAVAVLISGFVALSLTPMLCSRILQPLHGGGRLVGLAERSTASSNWLNAFYDRLLRGAMRGYWRVLTVAGVLIAVSVVAFTFMRRELVPVEDRGVGFGIVIAPEGSTLEYTDRYMREVEAIFDAAAGAPGTLHRDRPRASEGRGA